MCVFSITPRGTLSRRVCTAVMDAYARFNLTVAITRCFGRGAERQDRMGEVLTPRNGRL